jgi:hypothetical protein
MSIYNIEKEDFRIDKACRILLYARQYFRASRSRDWKRRQKNRELLRSRTGLFGAARLIGSAQRLAETGGLWIDRAWQGVGENGKGGDP